jgi:acetamidase/formamidase
MKRLLLFILTIYSLNCIAQSHKKVHFTPTSYYSAFSSKTKPVLTIKAGDTIVTGSVDCEGYDKKLNKCTIGPAVNPLTGPFYIEGAEVGDVVKISFTDIKFSRNTAMCLPYFHKRSMQDSITKLAQNDTVPLIWDLNFKNNSASLHKKTEHLKNFEVEIKPFLGCVGLAPQNGQDISTEDSGPFGGNMDFDKITTNASVYLPVFAKGGLLYIGDGHAAQGDGEINLSALETSLDYAFVVEVIKGGAKQMAYPRVEDKSHIMTVGMDATLDNAIKIANKSMLEWLQELYHLSIDEATQVMGSSMEYKITEIVDPKVEVAAMIKKKTLRNIIKTKSK